MTTEATWRYRLAYMDLPDGEREWGVVEYYDSLNSWTGFVEPVSEDKDSLLDVLQCMINDITRDEEPLVIEPETSFTCPNCGPVVKVDEDGCCGTCGADCEVVLRGSYGQK